jgi:peptidyl-prolyl cis-trans isomerase SurA
VREKLLDLRRRIIEGENFATLAVLYSEDPGSAPKGGELGFRNRSDFVPEFADAAFSLKENTVSPIVETDFGFHIIQLIARRGDQINVRHILIRPKIKPEEIMEAIHYLDSLADLIRKDSLSFEMAARYFSQDELSSVNGGVVINPVTGDTKFEMEHLDPSVVEAIRDLKIGEISEPFQSVDESGNTVFKIVKIKSRSNPHQANLKEDYAILHEMAKMEKQQEEFMNWIMDKQKTTYIKVNPPFRTCNFSNDGWLK